MADNYLITGYWGEPHVTAENDRGFNAAVFGAGKFVLPVGEMFRAEYIGNNTVRVYDGKLLDGGALAGIPAGKYIDFLIPEARQGMNRNDLIIFEYSQDASTLIESGVFKVVSGTETSGTAVDPVLHEEDLLSDEATLDQMALLRVPVSGAVISDPEIVFTTKYAGERVIDIAHGGTNAKTVAEARKNLGVEPTDQNILVNSDFSKPVSYGTSGTDSFILDGWTTSKLTIAKETDCIKTTPTATYAYIRQKVKVTPGRKYTCAAKFSNAGVGEIRIYDAGITTRYAQAGKISMIGSVSFTVPAGVTEISVMLYPNAANVASGIVYWAALYEGEYTAANLPQYQPHGYLQEKAFTRATIMKKLWQNSSPESTFDNHSFTVDVSQYNLIVIRYKLSTSYDVYDTAVCVKGQRGWLSSAMGSAGEGGSYAFTVWRQMAVNSNGLIVFYDAHRSSNNSHGQEEANDWCVPYAIYGIKGDIT